MIKDTFRGSVQGRLGRMARSQNGDGWSADEKYHPQVCRPQAWPAYTAAMPHLGNVAPPAEQWTGLDVGAPLFEGTSCGVAEASRPLPLPPHPRGGPRVGEENTSTQGLTI